MAKSPAFQFYPKDFLSDATVQMMSNRELGIYIRLLCHDWLEDGLPTDMELLSRIAKVDLLTFRKSWEIIGLKFEKTRGKNTKFRNPRIFREKKAQQRRRKERSALGKRGAKKRWSDKHLNSKSHSKSMATPMANDSSSSSSSSPSIPIPKGIAIHTAPSSNGSEPKYPITIPLVDKSEFQIPESWVSEWSEAYPAVDVGVEIRKIRQWCLSNPTKKKTQRGVRRFLTNWLARQQDRGGTVKPKKPKTAEDIRRELA